MLLKALHDGAREVRGQYDVNHEHRICFRDLDDFANPGFRDCTRGHGIRRKTSVAELEAERPLFVRLRPSRHGSAYMGRVDNDKLSIDRDQPLVTRPGAMQYFLLSD